MATLEDKILGEKLEYYCSDDSETEEPFGKDTNMEDNAHTATGIPRNDMETPLPPISRPHTSRNTGPKGVVEDWERFKLLQAERRRQMECQCIEIAKKATISASTCQEDERRKEAEEFDSEFNELLNEDFLQQFQKQRIAEMLRECGNTMKTFGKVQMLTTHENFLDCIENENKNTIVIIHIYDMALRSCQILNKCLDTLAADYTNVKFAKICCTVAGMSREFRNKGLPALLVYKNKDVIGNFVRLVDDLGEHEFYASDVENFLIERDILVDRNLLVTKIT